MAQLHARGELPVETDFVNESFIGSRFVGRIVGTTSVGDREAVVPSVTGRAWVTGTAQYMLETPGIQPRRIELGSTGREDPTCPRATSRWHRPNRPVASGARA